jgi:pimeloyl-ACP methyl ester carboxylesterase
MNGGLRALPGRLKCVQPGCPSRRSHLTSCALALFPALGLLLAGCSQTLPDRPERMTRAYIYYLDGAGGGGTLSNYAAGLKKGLRDAGYNGAGEMFKWNTGLGVVADQGSSVEYKRSKAAQCAQSIQQYAKDHPGVPVTLVGLSAGTAVTVFTLEALPPTCRVDNVILLGASISADYDLTSALQRVRNRMYVFTSEEDAVLSFLVPMSGTADRTKSPSAGLRGFDMPPSPSTQTRVEYAKVVYIRWRPEFEREGNYGGHTDTLKAPFVQEYIAPLIMASRARRVGVAPAAGMVRNPDYDRWAAFEPGAWTAFEGYQLVDGAKQPVRITARLVSKHEDRLVVERTYVPMESGQNEPSRVQQFLVEAQINPADHPFTSQEARISEESTETLQIAGKSFRCRVRTVEADGEFPEYGRGVWATVSQADGLPGGMARIWLKSHKAGQPFEFRGEAVKYGVQ